MKALTAAEMREVDRLTTERHRIPSLQLMETAGRKAADSVWHIVAGRGVDDIARVSVLCGKGNNGGDGFVVARHLREKKLATRAVLFGKKEDVSGDAAANLKKWIDAGGEFESVDGEEDWQRVWHDICESHVIVDAMLGTGLRGAATGTIARAISDLNKHSRNGTATWPALILAVDTPSGLPSDGEAAAGPVLVAHKTVTFTAPKIGQLESHNAAQAGALDVVQIGSPRSLVEEVGKGSLRWLEPHEFAQLPLVRPWDSNKGVYGNALLLAGSTGKSGAAILCGSAALRGGAGLVTIATPAPVLPMVAAAHPEYMTEPLEATPAGTIASSNWTNHHFAKLLEKKSVLGMGPGLGTEPETQDFI